ncbi:MAG: hypothetical protein ACI81R_002701, partial [Bradymonadia bacterium]
TSTQQAGRTTLKKPEDSNSISITLRNHLQVTERSLSYSVFKELRSHRSGFPFRLSDGRRTLLLSADESSTLCPTSSLTFVFIPPTPRTTFFSNTGIF